MHADLVVKKLKESLVKLQLEYVDLYLVHWCLPLFKYEGEVGTPSSESTEVIWKEFEKCHDEGLTKHIGVSNCTCSTLANLIASCRIRPAVNQVEIHPFNAQLNLVKWHKKVGVAVTCYAPLGAFGAMPSGVNVMQDPTIVDIATAHGVPSSQVVLAWGVQRGTIVIPKTTNPERLKENIGAYHVKLSEEEMAKIEALDQKE